MPLWKDMNEGWISSMNEIKKLLGLEGSPLSEAEILHKINFAQNKDLRWVEFQGKKGLVKVKIPSINSEGVFIDYDSQYC